MQMNGVVTPLMLLIATAVVIAEKVSGEVEGENE